MVVRIARPADLQPLARMCVALWPHTTLEEELRALPPILDGHPPGSLPHVFLVAEDDREIIGFAEVALRSHADGCDPARPVGFLEGWYVAEAQRGRGVGRALVEAAQDWARSHDCVEFASDVLIDNVASQRAHESLGFEVVDRCVNYRKNL